MIIECEPATRATVVVTSYRGAERLPRCLASVNVQTIRDRLDVLVIDDGSPDATSAVARSLGASVIRHERNRGIAGARNTGIQAAQNEYVLLLDDDCEAEPGWAEAMLGQATRDDVSVVGGELVVIPNDRGFCGGYLLRNNPFQPVEAALLKSNGFVFRLCAYLRANWRFVAQAGPRPVLAVAGGNSCFRRSHVQSVGEFTEGAPAAEETELCLRIRDQFPEHEVVYEPGARAAHYTETGLVTLLRRSRQYGRGNAFLMRARKSRRPTLYPVPILVVGAIASAGASGWGFVVALTIPSLFFPAGILAAFRTRRLSPLADPYLRVMIEAAGNLGFVEYALKPASAR